MSEHNNERQTHTFEFRDLIYILAVIVPVAVTWGVYSTKMNNLMDRVVEVRAESQSMKEEDVKLREIIHNIQLEVNNDHININNLKDRLQTIIDIQDKHADKHEKDSDNEKRNKS